MRGTTQALPALALLILLAVLWLASPPAARLDLVAGTGGDHDVERDNVGVAGLDGHEAQLVVEFRNRIGVREDLVNEVEPGRSGFAHLFEHMMFRGTEKFPPEKWEALMQDAGAETNAYTSDDRTVYHAVFSKEDLEPILALEADRFQNLSYTEEQFRTETRAVLGEYNKNFANPMRKLDEAIRKTAFTTHTYRHTTMGFIEDVENMPEMFDYGLLFFDRYYRPEYTTICIVGDVSETLTLPLVKKYWGGWEPGDYEPEIPAEPAQSEPKTIRRGFPRAHAAHHLGFVPCACLR